MLRKIVASSLITLLSSSLARGLPPSGSSGCGGFSSSSGSIQALQNFQSFQNLSPYSSSIHSLTVPRRCPPGIINDPLCQPNGSDILREAGRILGKEEESVIITSSESEPNFDDAITENPITHVSSLYNNMLWNNGKDEGFAVLKEKDNKLEYFGGTLMPLGGENNDNRELIGNYVQFVHDTVNLDRLVWSEDGKLTSKGKLVKVLKEKTSSIVTKLRYNDTNFYIEQISKSAPSYTSTKKFVHINYDNGNATVIDIEKTLENKLSTSNKRSIPSNNLNEK